MLSRSYAIARRGISQSAVLRGHGQRTAQDVLPFNPFQNKWKLLAKMSIAFGIAFNLPFIVVLYGLRKKNGPQ